MRINKTIFLLFDSGVNPSPPKYRNQKLEKMINDNKNESSVYLNSEKLTDQDMEIVAYYLLRKNTVRKLCSLQTRREIEVELGFVFFKGCKTTGYNIFL